MVDGTALEMRRACKGSVGSNPTLSATARHELVLVQTQTQIAVPTAVQNNISPNAVMQTSILSGAMRAATG